VDTHDHPAELSAEELRLQIAGTEWYHTLELARGVETPGWFDTRRALDRVSFPPSLDGLRCLDVGTFDGFWAFEMERRGAAHVHAIDLIDPHRWDWPADRPDEVLAALAGRKRGGAGFQLAHRQLGSSVTHEERSVYDLSPDDLGKFDFVYFGSLLLHLRDPVRALSAAAAVCDGQVLLVDAVDPVLSLFIRNLPVATLDGQRRPWWWRPNVAGIRRMAEAAGLRLTRPPVRFRMPPGAGQARPGLGALRERTGRRAFFDATMGDPHAALHLEPA
jgi:tRNA (mo5U34)-methyltransferase